MEDTPERIGKMVRATFTGTGSKKILLIAHMDTVYQRGMLEKQPFRIDGDRAYGLGIADDKQGVALILHTVSMLKALDFKSFGTLTVLINADEELSSPGSRSLLTKLGAEHDATFSAESSRVESDKLALATAGIASFTLNVEGRASHAGSAPERGVNAIYELAHQMLQTRNLSDPETGLKMNWTMANGGRVRNDSAQRTGASGRARAKGRGLCRHREDDARRIKTKPARLEGRCDLRAARRSSDAGLARLRNMRSRSIARSAGARGRQVA
jgi:glutamate carboxypeptidase